MLFRIKTQTPYQVPQRLCMLPCLSLQTLCTTSLFFILLQPQSFPNVRCNTVRGSVIQFYINFVYIFTVVSPAPQVEPESQ